MEGAKHNSSMNRLYSGTFMLAEASKRFVGDGTMGKSESPLKIYRKNSSEELSVLERR